MRPPFRPVRLSAGLTAAVALAFFFGSCSTPRAAPAAPAGAHRSASAGAAPTRPVRDSVVRVFSTVRLPEPLRPWAKGAPKTYNATGVVIAGDRILTSTHAVEFASDIEVQAGNSGDQIPAKVECLAPTAGLAILTVSAPGFFAKHPALPLATALPQVKDTILVYGYAAGTTDLSVSNYVVSSVDFAHYSYSVSGLRLKIDTRLTAGMMGAPAVINGRLAGLAFALSARNASGGASYFIPAEEIALFLHSISGGHYTGKPGIFDGFQTLTNPALRAFLRIPASVTGIVVNRPYRDDAAYPLKKWDVITKIGSTPLDDEGMIDAGGGLRVWFAYLVQKLVRNGRVPLTIMRQGKTRRIELPVSPDRPLVEPYLNGHYPSYFIYGPLVFSPSTYRFVITIRRSALVVNLLSATHNPLYTRQFDKPAFPGEQLVVVSSPFFSDRLTQGYANAVAGVVKSVDGIRIKNLLDLVKVLRDANGKFVRFEFDGRGREVLVFPRAEMEADTNRILDENNVRSRGSPDAMKVWEGRPST